MTSLWDQQKWIQQLTRLEDTFSKGQFSHQDHHVEVIGFGEISTILQFQKQPQWVVKRMPIFSSIKEANNYLQTYLEYNRLLVDCGLNIPLSQEYIIGKNPVSLYLLQEAFKVEQIVSNALRNAATEASAVILKKVIQEIEKIFYFNEKNSTEYLLSCDGQSSNWALSDDGVYFIDTSTPLYKKSNVEQLEYELLLKSTPPLLRGIIRRFFLNDVLNRYYKKDMVYMDLIANLQKEQLTHLIPNALEMINPYLDNSLTEKAVIKYYQNDKFIWQVFLSFRKFDRWLHKHCWHKPYQYLLPDKVQR